MPASPTIAVGAEDSPNLDLALKTLEVLGKQLERMQPLREEYSGLIREVVSVVLGFPDQMHQKWNELRHKGMASRVEEVQAQRETFLHCFERRIGSIKHVIRLAQLASAIGEGTIPGSEKLPAALQELERLKGSIFPQWVTVEDLEDILAAHFSLPTKKLEELGKKYPPPQAWYEQEGKPF